MVVYILKGVLHSRRGWLVVSPSTFPGFLGFLASIKTGYYLLFFLFTVILSAFALFKNLIASLLAKMGFFFTVIHGEHIRIWSLENQSLGFFHSKNHLWTCLQMSVILSKARSHNILLSLILVPRLSFCVFYLYLIRILLYYLIIIWWYDSLLGLVFLLNTARLFIQRQQSLIWLNFIWTWPLFLRSLHYLIILLVSLLDILQTQLQRVLFNRLFKDNDSLIKVLLPLPLVYI